MKTEVTIATMDDIIFEKRNKLYGAYELRRNYHQRLFRSFIISICLMVSVFLFSQRNKVVLATETFIPLKDSVKFSNDFYVEQQKPLQHFTRQIQQPDEHAFIAVTDTNDRVDIKDTVPITTTAVTSVSGGGESGGDTTGTTVVPFTTVLPSVRNMASVDKIPEFPGGLEKFYSFLLKRIHYTNAAMEAKVNGKLYVKFIIDEEGMVSSISLASRIGFGLDEQVQSVLAESPRWEPGSIKNTAVKTEMILPVSFNLK